MKNHPLFEEHPDADVRYIYVARFESGGMARCAQRFTAEELADLPELFGRFGGGRYELTARDEKKIVAKAGHLVSGRPRPLNAAPDEGDVAGPPAPLPAVGAAAAGGDPLVATILTMLFQMMMQQSQQTMQFLQAMMQARGGESREHIQAIQAQNAATIGMLGQLFQASKGGGGLDTNQLLSVLKMGMDLKEGVAEGLAELRTKVEGDGLDPEKFVKAFDGLVDTLGKAKDLADRGVPEKQAQEELQNMAAGLTEVDTDDEAA